MHLDKQKLVGSLGKHFGKQKKLIFQKDDSAGWSYARKICYGADKRRRSEKFYILVC